MLRIAANLYPALITELPDPPNARTSPLKTGTHRDFYALQIVER